jgi:hypothetical protein
VDDGKLVDGCLIDGSRVGGDGDQTEEKRAHGGPSWLIRIPELLGLVGLVGSRRIRSFVAGEGVVGFEGEIRGTGCGTQEGRGGWEGGDCGREGCVGTKPIPFSDS